MGINKPEQSKEQQIHILKESLSRILTNAQKTKHEGSLSDFPDKELGIKTIYGLPLEQYNQIPVILDELLRIAGTYETEKITNQLVGKFKGKINNILLIQIIGVVETAISKIRSAKAELN